jgi:hypothetical protein
MHGMTDARTQAAFINSGSKQHTSQRKPTVTHTREVRPRRLQFRAPESVERKGMRRHLESSYPRYDQSYRGARNATWLELLKIQLSPVFLYLMEMLQLNAKRSDFHSIT